MRLLAEEHRAEEAAGGAPPAFGDGLPFVRHLMASDRKSAGLKLLQGLIWKEGYESGRLRGQVFADVPPAFAAWRRAGVRLRIFSSGSVLAQRLLFSTTPEGDLTVFLEGFHDLATGPKHEPASYRAIAAAFALGPEEVLFLSDSTAELDAAAAAGLETRLAVRPGNPEAPADAAPAGAQLRRDRARLAQRSGERPDREAGEDDRRQPVHPDQVAGLQPAAQRAGAGGEQPPPQRRADEDAGNEQRRRPTRCRPR